MKCVHTFGIDRHKRQADIPLLFRVYILPHEIFRHIWYIITPGSRQSKTLILSTNVDQNSLEKELSFVICHQSGDKWKSKTLFLTNFGPRSSIVTSVFDCRLTSVIMEIRD